jgi:hypothetical protein
MYVVFLLSMLLAGVMSFFIQNVKGMYASEQRMKLSGEMKKYASELIDQASRSNQFVLFKSAALADFNDNTEGDRQVMDESLLHPGGDFVVFVYYEIPKPVAETYHRITRIEGYFLNASTTGGTGPLRKLEITMTTASSSKLEDILVACWNTGAANFITASVTGASVKVSTCFPVVRALALPEVIDGVAVTGTPTPRLFYMNAARNVLISGQVHTSTKAIATKDWKTYTDTFFFNITPRT